MRGGLRGRTLALAALGLAGLGTAALWHGGAVPAPADRAAAPLAPAALAAPGAPLTLAVFGTSLTAGSRWPEAVAAGLSGCLGRPVPLVRVARPGATVIWAEGQVGRLAAARPDIVLLEFAINDADLRDGLPLSDSIARHRALIAALQAALPDMRIVLMTMSPAQGLRGLMRPRLAAHYAAYRKLAGETAVGLIDLYPRWRALPRAARGLADGLHPGDAVAQRVIVPVLLPYLGALAGADCPPA